MRFSTFVLFVAVLVGVAVMDNQGNAGDAKPVAEPVAQSPIIKRIRQRSVVVESAPVEKKVEACGPACRRTVSRSVSVEGGAVSGRGGLLSRLFNRRSRSVSVSRSYGASK